MLPLLPRPFPPPYLPLHPLPSPSSPSYSSLLVPKAQGCVQGTWVFAETNALFPLRPILVPLVSQALGGQKEPKDQRYVSHWSLSPQG